MAWECVSKLTSVPAILALRANALTETSASRAFVPPATQATAARQTWKDVH